ncbi:probable UDP-3-O-acyl-N-acetylglucosamine deacetylase 1, mitochondrial isoform X2 [Elaeis guineensis]|uniref:UDP-3-O-acyl-N-acetylglucosamine deacetylase n=1 Tax=Elaeis guineensis var. tenera TaxID=51953 RepID=A0A6I9RHA8_ELAGV|nr:probable UDP-3-O-acyl-N-acetylglucosamine deacetylase 2, mitochondrial isoform X3 [Elaeis guineensis]
MSPRGCLSAYSRALKPFSRAISWKPTGRPQQTLISEVSRSGTGLHSGASTTARLLPAMAGEGRYFVSGLSRSRVPAKIDHAVDSPLCTTLCGDGARVRTVEHLLSALEACGVDNCRIEIESGDEVPLLDGSAKGWVEAIEQVGLCAAENSCGHNMDKLAPELHEPMYLRRNDSFVAAFPSSKVQITYGIDFPKVERMRNAGLIQGGSAENAIVCSANAGWLNPPLRFHDEPCRHKVLDLVGDFSLFAQNGNQGLLLAHIIAYKAGHSLHTEFVRSLLNVCG